MRAYDGIKAERGREVTLETPDFLQHARQLLSRGIPVEIRMSGGSMRSAIEDGDIITIEPISENPVKPGDIILYQSRYDTAVIHRVVRVERVATERSVITRGDAAAQIDTPTPLHRILGRVKNVERAGERVSMKKARPRSNLAARLSAWLERFRFWGNR